MRSTITFLTLLISFSLFSQDIIVTKNNDEISSKVLEIGINKIKYKKQENLTGPDYFIEKDLVEKIIFENGTVEDFNIIRSQEKEISLQETKAFIKEYVDKYAYSDNGFLVKSYKVSYEGDFLRLTLLNKKKSKEIKSMLFDVKNAYAFKRASRRDNNLAYLNIYLPFLANEKKNKWEKTKLVISVEGYENAVSILKAMKHYKTLLVNKNKTESKF
ncbi:hypothetical protein [Corallibacter sp.]|uniref:hypothetical protein n=1 Tax=Corallibacter sp. TaxID=2038084 RepID=UPI003AB5AF34